MKKQKAPCNDTARPLGLASISLFAVPLALLSAACGDSTAQEPAQERIGQAEQLLTQCVTLHRAGGANVADALIAFPPGTSNYGSHEVLRVGRTDESLLRFDLGFIPAGAVVDSAVLKLFFYASQNDTLSVYAASAPWSEATVTYNGFNQQFDPVVRGIIDPGGSRVQKSVDVRALVAEWVTGERANDGFLLRGTANPPTYFWSSDYGRADRQPILELCYTTPDNHCDPDPCQNGATCVNNATGYACDCAPGYTGTDCEINIDDCAAQPCQNGGACTDGVSGYTCDCPAGFTGASCETNIDECAAQPCQNGGVCTDGINSYTCLCQPGFAGASCETNIDECAGGPCQNGGACTDGLNGYTCACATGFAGANCETNIDDCSPNPCQNGGGCVDGIASFTCACEAGFTGASCEINIDDCAGAPCHNGGLCSDGVNGYTCACAPGYAGATCEIDIDDCAAQPCQNNGLCVDGVNSYTCTCPDGWTGANCDVDIDECAAGDPCNLNAGMGAACTNTPGSYTCECIPLVAGADDKSCDVVCPCYIDAFIANDEATAFPWLYMGLQGVPGTACTVDASGETTVQYAPGLWLSASPTTCAGDGALIGRSNLPNIPQYPYDDAVERAACQSVIDKLIANGGLTCTAPPCDSITCQNGGSCVEYGTTGSCQCPQGFVGGFCEASLTTCATIKAADPGATDGVYTLNLDGTPFQAYCDMTTAGGGWTLIFNDGTSFDRSVVGSVTTGGPDVNGTSYAYSTLPVGADIMLDANDGNIVGSNYIVRTIVSGVRTPGLTIKQMFVGGPKYLEAEDNSNVTNIFPNGANCPFTPNEWSAAVCTSNLVITFSDIPFAIGVSRSYTQPHGNGAGWPNDPNYGGSSNYWPDNFRVWVR